MNSSSYMLPADRDMISRDSVGMQFMLSTTDKIGEVKAAKVVTDKDGKKSTPHGVADLRVVNQLKTTPLNLGRTLDTGNLGLSVDKSTGNYDVPFQFPPIITTDNKGGNWKEINCRSEEPIALFEGATPREISVNWSYIVTGERSPVYPVQFDVLGVSTIVKSIRGYFFNRAYSNLVVKFFAYNIVGDGGIDDQNDRAWSFRITSLNVTHSDVMVKDVISVADRKGDTNSGQYARNLIYPLETKITATLKYYVNITPDYERAKFIDSQIGGTTQVDDLSKVTTMMKSIPGMKSIPSSVQWY